MCLILFATGAHARFPLIVAANRDESYARPAADADYWPDAPSVYGGRDLTGGGTWLAVSTRGRFAATTNFRQGVPRDPAARSRGELTQGFLTGSASAPDYLRQVACEAARYNGFSLIVGSPRELWFFSNRGASAHRIEPGVHGLSNHLLDEPWPKVRQGVAALESLLSADEDAIVTRMLDVLADRTPAPDHLLPSTGIDRERERAVSASFIPGDAYGTRASTVVIVGASGDTLFMERRFGPGGRPLGENRTRLRFSMTQASSASAPNLSSMVR